jgi:hypothetical protein
MGRAGGRLRPDVWEQKGYVLYERIGAAAARLGHDTAAQLAEQAIALVDRETKERTKVVSLTDLEERWTALKTELELLDGELQGLVNEDLELRVFLHQADRFTDPSDIAAAKETQRQIVRQYTQLYQQREQTAIAENTAVIAYREACNQVEIARKNLAWLDSAEFKANNPKMPPGDIATHRKRNLAVLNKFGVGR